LTCLPASNLASNSLWSISALVWLASILASKSSWEAFLFASPFSYMTLISFSRSSIICCESIFLCVYVAL
jgi:hypothetical protein